jgi:hypothetical protein
MQQSRDILDEVFSTALAPARIIYKSVDGLFAALENEANRDRDKERYRAWQQAEQNRNQTRLLNLFIFYKNYLINSPSPNDKWAYYYLCAIESRQEPQRSQLIMVSTMKLECNWGPTVNEMSADMQRASARIQPPKITPPPSPLLDQGCHEIVLSFEEEDSQ